MQDQLISFETATLAYEKGFHQPIGLGIKYNLGQYYTHKGELNGDCIDQIKAYMNKEPFPYKVVNAPTQSLLQKWLREVHQIHIEIGWWDTGWSAQMIGDQLISDDTYEAFDKDTYEEALEIGLQFALKSIK